jgi:hypothetical protein
MTRWIALLGVAMGVAGCRPEVDETPSGASAAGSSSTGDDMSTSEAPMETPGRPDVGGGTTIIDASSSSEDSSTTDSATGSSSSTGDPGLECIEDMFEDNDSFGFPADFEGERVDAVACGGDPDWFQITDVAVTRLTFEQATGDSGSGEPFANLLLEAHCGIELCDFDDSTAAQKSVGFDACDCPEGERRFVHVVAVASENPPTGTRYSLSAE